ncbi:metal ABC transporter substrate-binding protein [Candidatus Methylomirabilis sp.]|uniref:metal ABC transporter substrate-binding protein n=1 Tax=Candidatus Methylomirabilis sp. TaxID=2032687 RepID=UPI003C78603D
MRQIAQRTYRRFTLALLMAPLALTIAVADAQVAARPIQICATVPDLGSLAHEVGGDQVSVTVFAKGTEDAHFIEAKPSFIKTLSQCDLYLQVGMDLEIGWAPVLLQNARNGAVLPGGRGYIDASGAILRLEVPTGPVDRSMGDVHPLGNPHYLLDPLNGLKVARLIRDKLVDLRPDRKAYFEDHYISFNLRLGTALVGEKLAKKYDVEKLALLYEHGKLAPFLKGQGEAPLLQGWLGRMLPHFGTKVVADHNMWPYFARRFGIAVIGFMEPKPGVPPTTKQLGTLVDLMRAERVGAVLTVSYYDPRHARFISQQTGARIVNLAHQVGARAGTDDYLAMINYNVREAAAALEGS